MNKLPTYVLLGSFVPVLATAAAVTGRIVIDGMEYAGDRVVRGNHQRAEAQRPLPCFEQITLEVAVDLTYIPGRRCQARLVGDANLLDLIETRVQGDRLQITAKGSFQTENPLRIEINGSRIQEIELRSAADIHLRQVNSPRLKIHLLGSGGLRGDGKVGDLEVFASGSGTVDFSRLQAARVYVRASGATDIRINTRESLTVDLSGASDVIYYGHPSQVTTRISGAGDVAPAQ